MVGVKKIDDYWYIDKLYIKLVDKVLREHIASEYLWYLHNCTEGLIACVGNPPQCRICREKVPGKIRQIALIYRMI